MESNLHIVTLYKWKKYIFSQRWAVLNFTLANAVKQILLFNKTTIHYFEKNPPIVRSLLNFSMFLKHTFNQTDWFMLMGMLKKEWLTHLSHIFNYVVAHGLHETAAEGQEGQWQGGGLEVTTFFGKSNRSLLSKWPSLVWPILQSKQIFQLSGWEHNSLLR